MLPHARPNPFTRAATFLCAVVVLGCALAPVAVAATDAPDPPDPDAYRSLALEVSRNTKRIADLGTQIDQSNARIASLDGAIGFTQQRLDATRAEIARYRGIVRSRAAFMYTHLHSPQEVLDIHHIEDVAPGKQYVRAAATADVDTMDALTRTAQQFSAHLGDLQASRQQEQSNLDALVSAKTALQTVTARQQKQLDDAGNITIMGDAELTPDQITAWFQARGTHYQLSGDTTIADLAAMFIEEGAAEHVRGDIAFAQSILETGSFAHALDNNYGGIGACDSCSGEIAFPTPRDGVRGQIQMLRNYADPTSRAANLANPPSPPIYGSDPVASAVAYDTFFAKGRVPTWNLMGNGNWATAPEYAPKVLGIYFDMLAFAAHRT
ncbi:MAG TPA: glucosaminidase domain-containing protein [Acidimicrobiia bacterium]|nr:glucosaminidase domain-containing protein [Acidimicrobiia bacterium]